jgi:hypothetical protein
LAMVCCRGSRAGMVREKLSWWGAGVMSEVGGLPVEGESEDCREKGAAFCPADQDGWS